MNCAICPPGLASLKREATRVLERPCVGTRGRFGWFQRRRCSWKKWKDSHFVGVYSHTHYMDFLLKVG